jgi:hypothetical protein
VTARSQPKLAARGCAKLIQTAVSMSWVRSPLAAARVVAHSIATPLGWSRRTLAPTC